MPISSPPPALHKSAQPYRTRSPHRCIAAQALQLLRRTCLFALLSLVSSHAQTLAHPGLQGNGLNTDPWWQHAVFYQIGEPTSLADATHTPPSSAPAADYKAIAAKLDALRSLGVDALVLPMPPMPAQLSMRTTAAAADTSQDPAGFASPDELDELIHQASRQGIRVLLSFSPASATPDLSAIARFWLSRGVAGLRVSPPKGTSPQDAQAIVQALRRATSASVGQRIVLADLDDASLDSVVTLPAYRPTARPTGRSSRPIDPASAQLQVDARLGRIGLPDAASLRTQIAQTLAQPPDRPQSASGVVLDVNPAPAQPGTPDAFAALTKAIAAIVTTTHGAALIDADENLFLNVEKPEPAPAPTPATPQPAPLPALQPAPLPGATFTLAAPPVRPRQIVPPTPQRLAAVSLTNWYGQLIALHHGNAAVRYGTTSMLNFDAQNALVWVNRPATNSRLTPPVVVACNLSSVPVQLSLGSALKSLDLHGSFLRTLMRSDSGMGAQDLNAVTLAPFAVYIGELRR